MRITLIRPQLGTGKQGAYNSPARMEPTALAILAALTPKHVSIRAFDERFQPIPFDEPTDLVALSVCTFSARRAYEIAKKYREKGVKVVMGGFHPTLCPDEALEYADAIACGDAEGTWPRILSDFSAGKLEKIYRPDVAGPFEGAIPDRSIFPKGIYLPIRLVQFNRGCNRVCEFCSIRAFYQGCFRYRPVASVVEELRQTRARRVFFTDDNIISDRDKFKELLEAIIPLRLRWSTQIDLSFADDTELLNLAKRSGCQSVTIGFESLNERNLQQMGKAWNKAQFYTERLARIRAAGIMVYGTFVFGYDEDTPETIAATVDFAIREKLFIANFNPLQALPGTALYARMQREGRLRFPNWWLDDRYRWHEALIVPRGMSPQELTQGCAMARKKFNAPINILRRFWGSRANMGSLDNAAIFWVANIVSRMDIRAKSQLRLGKEENSQ